jgi:hypothetical protein
MRALEADDMALFQVLAKVRDLSCIACLLALHDVSHLAVLQQPSFHELACLPYHGSTHLIPVVFAAKRNIPDRHRSQYLLLTAPCDIISVEAK